MHNKNQWSNSPNFPLFCAISTEFINQAVLQLFQNPTFEHQQFSRCGKVVMKDVFGAKLGVLILLEKRDSDSGVKQFL